MHLKVLQENKPTKEKGIAFRILRLSNHSHILIETFVQIVLEHNQYVHDLSTNQVDNELVQEQVVTFVQDQRLHAIIKQNHLKILFVFRIFTSSGINDRQIPRRTPRLVIVVNICSTVKTSSS